MASTDPGSLPLVGLLGAGRMGRGIAVAFAHAGIPSVLIDLKDRPAADLQRMRRDVEHGIDQHLDSLVSLGAVPSEARDRVAGRIRFSGRSGAREALGEVDVLFEGVSETISAKQDALGFAGRFLRRDAILASTTSTMLSTALADHVPRPERFLCAHWLNPAFLMPIVELSPHPGTAPEAVTELDRVLRLAGKRPIHVAARPGYVVPRLQSLILNEAARMVEEGVASAQDIDEAVRLGFGLRYATVGALEFIDFGGLDVLYHANTYLTGALGERYRLAPIVERYMAEGRTGLSAGTGFYDWTGDIGDQRRKDVLARQYALLQLLGAAPQTDRALQDGGTGSSAGRLRTDPD